MKETMACILQLQEITESNIYLVGGSIRDLLLKRELKDLDFVIDQNPETFVKEISKKLKASYFMLDEKNRVYRVQLKDGFVLDFSQMRGRTIEEDLMCRDFTINAMAYPVALNWPIDAKNIIDPLHGQKDLKNKTIKHVGEGTFKEDPLRMMRAVRFMAQLDFELDLLTEQRIKENAQKIQEVAGERIAAELFAILKEDRSYFYLSFMDKHLTLLDKIFPEIKEMKEIGECKYHVVDSWTHSIYTVKIAESVIYAKNFFEEHIRQAYEKHMNEVIAGGRTRLQLMKLGALFHDIGKPSARKVDETGRVRFRGHEVTGAELVKVYGEKLKLSVRERDILYRYVHLHMGPLVLYKNNDVSGRALYKMFNEMEEETLDILLIGFSDIVATRRLLDPYEEMGMFKVHIEYIANNYLTRYKPIEQISSIITGREVMEALKLAPGVMIGEILEEVRKAVYSGHISPSKEGALRYIRENLLEG